MAIIQWPAVVGKQVLQQQDKDGNDLQGQLFTDYQLAYDTNLGQLIIQSGRFYTKSNTAFTNDSSYLTSSYPLRYSIAFSNKNPPTSGGGNGSEQNTSISTLVPNIGTPASTVLLGITVSASNLGTGGWSTNFVDLPVSFQLSGVTPGSYVYPYLTTYRHVPGNLNVYTAWYPHPAFAPVEIPNPVTYTITFDANGGKYPPSSIQVTQGSAFTTPSGDSMGPKIFTFILTNTITGEGAGIREVDGTFSGWYTTPLTGGQGYMVGVSITPISNMTIYARWSASTTLSRIGDRVRTLTYDARNGVMNTISGLPSTYTVTRTNTFKGWHVVGTDLIYLGQYTTWPDQTDTINFAVDSLSWNGSDPVENPLLSATCSQQIVLSNQGNSPSTTTLVQNMTMLGWYTAATGGTRIGGPGDVWTWTYSQTISAQYAPSPIVFPEPISRYAQINYYCNSETSLTGKPNPYQQNINSIFNGWYSSTTGGTRYGSVGDSYTPTGPTQTIYAQYTWVATTILTPDTSSYTVTLNPTGGTVSPTTITKSAIFNGWYSAASSGTRLYSGGEVVTLQTTTPQNIYAQTSNPAIGSMPPPTRSQCLYRGWFSAEHGGTLIIETTPITGNTTIYAQWAYLITYLPMGGRSDILPQTQVKEDNIAINISQVYPDREGYDFKGWSISGVVINYNGGDLYSANAPLQLLAVWSDLTFLVRFEDGKGNILKSQTVGWRGAATPPANPTRTGWKFMGWAGNYTEVISDRVIRATWAYSNVWVMTSTGWQKYYG